MAGCICVFLVRSKSVCGLGANGSFLHVADISMQSQIDMLVCPSDTINYRVTLVDPVDPAEG